MFEGWLRADVISALSLGVSSVALAVSLLVAAVLFVQMRIAQPHARNQKAARELIVESSIHNIPAWPDWYALRLFVRNRHDTSIVVETTKIRSPRQAKVITFRDASDGRRNDYGRRVLPEKPPDLATMRREAWLETEIMSTSFQLTNPPNVVTHDQSHIELLVHVPSNSSKRHCRLEILLNVRVINESKPYAASVVIVKVPTLMSNRSS